MNDKKFSGPIKAEWIDGEPRKMRILENVSYIDPKGVAWWAMVGDVVDGSSIPRLLWAFEGSPFVGLHRVPSVFHDVACQKKNRPCRKVHQMYDDAMKDCGVPAFSRKKKAFAVKSWGPRW